MTLERLICACYNVYPYKTIISIVDLKTHNQLVFGVLSDSVLEKYGGLNVIGFNIGELMESKSGCATLLTVYVLREEDLPCATQ